MSASAFSDAFSEPLQAAIGFLTPLGSGETPPSPQAMAYFPLVGAAIGLGIGVAWRKAHQSFGPHCAAAIVLGLDVLTTGALHLDGLGDSADGLFAHAPSKSRLEIMSEPDLGTFGTVAIALSLVAREAALSELEPSPLLLAGLYGLSRSLMVIGSRVLPYARAEGLASGFLPVGDEPDIALLSATVGAGLSALLSSLGSRRGLRGAFCGSVAAAGVLGLARQRLDGFTGDVLGAAGVVCEAVGLLVAASR